MNPETNNVIRILFWKNKNHLDFFWLAKLIAFLAFKKLDFYNYS